ALADALQVAGLSPPSNLNKGYELDCPMPLSVSLYSSRNINENRIIASKKLVHRPLSRPISSFQLLLPTGHTLSGAKSGIQDERAALAPLRGMPNKRRDRRF